MTPGLPDAEKKLESLKDETTLLLEQDAKDRGELVTPAEPGFKPKLPGRKLELTLIPQKTILRKGEPFWFRAELRNVGSEPVRITDPFIKSGSGGDGWSKFRLAISPSPPASDMLGFGSAGEPCLFDHPPVPGWERLTDDQKAGATARWMMQSKFKGRVNVELLPGETIRTRDWRPVSREDGCAAEKSGQVDPSRPGGLFRQHARVGDFQKQGTYHVKLHLDDPGTAGSRKLREILAAQGHPSSETDALLDGPFSRPALSATSNEVAIEVVP